MLEKVKLALRITTNAYDQELLDLIEAAKIDLGIAGVLVPVMTDINLDAIITRAIITYCKVNFGEPDEYNRLKASYDEQKAQLSMATGYTTWTDHVLCSVRFHQLYHLLVEGILVLVVVHVYEVNDDDASHVSESELSCNLFGCVAVDVECVLSLLLVL